MVKGLDAAAATDCKVKNMYLNEPCLSAGLWDLCGDEAGDAQVRSLLIDLPGVCLAWDLVFCRP